MARVLIFVSYSHEDSRWFEPDPDPLKHWLKKPFIPWLADSLHREDVELWYDEEIDVGNLFRPLIIEKIGEARIAILLVSHGFLNSEFIEKVELPRIKERADRGDLVVIPILTEPCGWEEIDFFNSRQIMRVLPGKPKPLIDFVDSERAWRYARDEILNGIKKVIRKLPPPPLEKEKERTNELARTKDIANGAKSVDDKTSAGVATMPSEIASGNRKPQLTRPQLVVAGLLIAVTVIGVSLFLLAPWQKSDQSETQTAAQTVPAATVTLTPTATVKASPTASITPTPSPASIATPLPPTKQSTPGPGTARPTPAPTIPASTYIKRANALYTQRKREEAMAACDQALRIDPKNVEALQLREKIRREIEILKPQPDK